MKGAVLILEKRKKMVVKERSEFSSNFESEMSTKLREGVRRRLCCNVRRCHWQRRTAAVVAANQQLGR